MKKVGKEVLFLSTNPNNSRNGEGSFARLDDGRIMFAYTQYVGNFREDHATARIAVCYSSDEGETWTEPSVLLEKPETALNLMSVNLLKLANGELGIMYLQKDALEDGFIICRPVYRFSKDDGKTWSKEILCIKEPIYCIVNNHRMVQQKNGRLLVPVAYYGDESVNTYRDGKYRIPYLAGKFRLMYSDDDGRSWALKGEVCSPYDDVVGLEEPGIFELDDGRLWAYFRTMYGHQYQSFSFDGGETWSVPMPNWKFTSPNSPMLITRVKDYTIAIFNPLGYSVVNKLAKNSGSPRRSPYVCAISRDGGLSFDNSRGMYSTNFANDCVYLEDDEKNTYCYPAVIDVESGFLVAYYHSNGSNNNLNCCKITKISWDEIRV